MRLDQALTIVTNSGMAMVAEPSNGITGVAVGHKDGSAIGSSDEFCVTAFVSRKLTPSELETQHIQSFDRVYAAATGASSPESSELDVIETGDVFRVQPRSGADTPQRGPHGGNPPALNTQKPFRSLRVGIGVTNPVSSYPAGLSVGTAGFYMRDDNGNLYLVSNNHVIGDSNNASIGDKIVQPGTLDLTVIELSLMPNLAALDTIKIGQLTALVRLNYATALPPPINRVDAAIARLDPALRATDDVDRLAFGGGIVGVAPPYQANADGTIQGSDRVYKVGRTTGYTEGTVTNIAATAAVPYSGGTAFFAGQIAVRPTADNVGRFSDPGDSGSGVLNDRHELVGLLFAGSPERTLINPIAEVIDELRTAASIPTLEVVTV